MPYKALPPVAAFTEAPAAYPADVAMQIAHRGDRSSGVAAGRRLARLGNARMQDLAARKLQAIIGRLEKPGYGIVMISHGYSRAEVIVDLPAILRLLSDERRKDERNPGDRSGP